jgi:hypothetical protein
MIRCAFCRVERRMRCRVLGRRGCGVGGVAVAREIEGDEAGDIRCRSSQNLAPRFSSFSAPRA